MIRWFLLAAALFASGPAIAQQVPIDPAALVRTYPHDPRAYTEGLFYLDGALYESTGEVGRSGIRKVDLDSGKVRSSVAVEPPLFGEGIAPWRDQIISLTWKNGIGFRWSINGFRKLGSFRYPGEGWALTADGTSLIMSDGTATLRFLDPRTFQQRRTLRVTANGLPIERLNELEYVDGEILANVWLTDRIARIDPKSGHVIGWIDLSALHARANVWGDNQVANGIAWHAARRRLFVTGKEWPYLFEIAPPKGARPGAARRR
ncbi:glutaminyl-peptide cyclotransferase [Sphingomonas alpina]|uniref:Glutaminyl-peptide cyclotransferase n=1 Tax=Sphingomonas alpina TaxID=653931 RepID=A0A7H0LK98_9SPHN|nr:glutaminyl-peptide cyclotransferase [Sphingomonas alpina]QNQ10101.1 glutaminyl-peptide cyclotransferase [Sphingomonas alpina]